MSGEGALLARLAELKLHLETLKLHGHRFIECGDDESWLNRLRAGGLDWAPGQPIRPSPDMELRDNIAAIAPQKASNSDEFEAVEREAGSCRLCTLSKTRTNVVFGVGSVKARLMFVGEAPGRDEDLQGEPFVGRAGRLLTDMIAAMGLKRSDVYIANILKCRPPNNRKPAPDEVECCEPYLKRQIRIMKPEVICALGAVAAQTLLKTKAPISRLRGEFHSYEGAGLLPTFHPAYLLRNPAAKTDAWEDLQMVMKKLGLEIPEKK